ncbi:ATP-binding protein [Streptomyces sp. NPDC002835]|jgi:anti-sigma regulatory factor (Ser/Thr protein kinase)
MTRRARIAVAGGPSAVAFARDRVITHIEAWGLRLGEDEQNAIRLVASELITNAVVHAGGFVTVALDLKDDMLVLVVHDGSPEPPRRQNTTEDDEGGRGLELVDFLAARSGWERTNKGKKVWVEFGVPVSGQGPRGRTPRERTEAAAPQADVHVRPVPFVMAPDL